MTLQEATRRETVPFFEKTKGCALQLLLKKVFFNLLLSLRLRVLLVLCNQRTTKVFVFSSKRGVAKHNKHFGFSSKTLEGKRKLNFFNGFLRKKKTKVFLEKVFFN